MDSFALLVSPGGPAMLVSPAGLVLNWTPGADEPAYSGGTRRRARDIEPPTPEQVDAERIRLGILAAKSEVKRATNRAKQLPPQSRSDVDDWVRQQRERIAGMQAEYNRLARDIEQRGMVLRGIAIYEAAQAEIRRRKAQAEAAAMAQAVIERAMRQEEEDVAYIMMVLAAMD